MLTRAQSKAQTRPTSSVAEVPQADSSPAPLDPATVASASAPAPAASVSECSLKSSASIRAQILAVQAAHARKAADAQRARNEREEASEAVARKLELEAEIAEIEANCSRRGSSRRSSRLSSHESVSEWLETSAHRDALDPRRSPSLGAFISTRPGSPAPVTNVPITVRPVGTVDVSIYSRPGCSASVVAAPQVPAPALAGPSVLHDRLASPTRAPGCLAKGPRCCAPADNAQSNRSDLFLLAQTIKNLANPASISDKNIPKFDGKLYEWLAFKRAYDDSASHHTPQGNIARLNTALFGPAREAVGALLATALDPNEIILVLELHFGRPELIVLHEVAAVRSLPKVHVEGKDLHFFAARVRSCVSVMKFLNNKAYLESPELHNSLLLKLTPALRSRWKDYAKSRFHLSEATKLELLADFLSEEVTSELQFGAITEAYLADRPHNTKTFRTAVTESSPFVKPKEENKMHSKLSSNKQICLYCQQSHMIDNCDKFIHLDIMSKLNWVRDQKVCSRCLKKGSHRYRSCNPRTLCQIAGCKFRHHKLLHSYQSVNTHTSTETNCTSVEPEPTFSTPVVSNECETVAHSLSRGPLKVLLKVIPVTVSGPAGSMDTYALLDDGSSSTFIEAEVASQIGVSGPKSEIRVECMGGLSKLTEIEYVDFYIKGIHDPTIHEVRKARAISGLGLSSQSLSINDIRHLSIPNVPYENAEPKLIIGLDNWHLLTPKEVRHSTRSRPAACLTPLGWVVFGFTSSKTRPITFVNHSVSGDDFTEIENLIKDNYKLESIGIVKRQVVSATNERAINLLETTARRLPDGQFEVGLLWQSGNIDMPDSYPLALSRFNSLERRFVKDKVYAKQYMENVHAMINKGYAEPCAMATNSERVWYLPHFGVVNPNKPGKLRVVHDAAARVLGTSLNSLLLTGPDLLSSLVDIIYRFREDMVGMAADIKEMFPQIKIRSEDRDAQRFLWRDSPDLPICIFRMSSMIFGTASSPFTALFIKNKNADEHRDAFPAAAHAIVHDTYMDDYIGSVDGIDNAAQLARDIVKVQKRAHFEVRGWVSNEPDALALVPPHLKLDGSTKVDIAYHQQWVRTLGLVWYHLTDQLGFNTDTLKTAFILPEKVTKRIVLSTIMRVFDPLGLLAPITIRGRIIFQVLWRRKVGWDEALSHDLLSQWRTWLSSMSSSVDLRIPRWHSKAAELLERELHVFCDASEHAYVAVAYWRLVFADGDVRLSFICSKSKVSPLTPTTISRLELQAALVAARLASSLCEAHKYKPARRHFWTDSKNVLAWLRSDARSYLPFVAHRLADISELTAIDEWRWVPTILNVADDATRPDPVATLRDSRWIEGPEFLKSPASDWPIEIITTTRPNTIELKPNVRINIINVDSSASHASIHVPCRSVSADAARFSKWLCLIRSTARVLQAAKMFSRLRGRMNTGASISHTTSRNTLHTDQLLPPLFAPDLHHAQLHILLKCQEDCFQEELASLRLEEPLPHYSKLAKLHVILKSDGLMALSGRIGEVDGLPSTRNFPTILDASHPAVRLLIEHYHRRHGHANNEAVVNELRQKYWILGVRSAVRSVSHDCKICRIRKARPFDPRMGNLPAARLAHHRRPFSFVGLDYFGPVLVTIGRRHEKRYVALYTCLTTRAIHIEVVHDLSTDAAVMALRRFTARRGSPIEIWSDNGTAFVGLTKFLKELYGPKITDFAANAGINWRFIPPSAPSMGGAWERLVRSVKSSLQTVLKERAPKEPVLATLLCEAEALLNSRPLTHVSTDPSDPEALTPFHFLIGTASTANHVANSDRRDLYGRAEWRKAVRLADMFWQRWIKEYLPTLVPRRSSPAAAETPLAVGDLVLIVDSNLPRGTWPRGRVSRTFPGRDGIIRVAEVSTAGGVLRRPCKKLVRLPA